MEFPPASYEMSMFHTLPRAKSKAFILRARVCASIATGSTDGKTRAANRTTGLAATLRLVSPNTALTSVPSRMGTYRSRRCNSTRPHIRRCRRLANGKPNQSSERGETPSAQGRSAFCFLTRNLFETRASKGVNLQMRKDNHTSLRRVVKKQPARSRVQTNIGRLPRVGTNDWGKVMVACPQCGAPAVVDVTQVVWCRACGYTSVGLVGCT